jgi:hypothetical protein
MAATGEPFVENPNTRAAYEKLAVINNPITTPTRIESGVISGYVLLKSFILYFCA